MKVGVAQTYLSRVGFSHSHSYPVEGLSGGISFFWRLGVVFDLLLLDRNCISVCFNANSCHSSWTLSFIHSPMDWQQKALFWENLSTFGNQVAGS